MDRELASRILTRVDAETLGDRAERLAWLERHGQPAEGRLLPGGFAAATAFWEAGACFVSGQYLATILLAQACLEHLLDGALAIYAGDERGHKLSAQNLLKRSQEMELLTEGEFELFDRLRRSRNPHAHPRAADDPTSFMRRAIDTQTPPEQIYRQDAESAITGLKDLLDRPPFALGPRVPFVDEDASP